MSENDLNKSYKPGAVTTLLGIDEEGVGWIVLDLPHLGAVKIEAADSEDVEMAIDKSFSAQFGETEAANE